MIHTGDCITVMRTMPSESIDAIVTDPPAGIRFMSKNWDHDKGGRTQWVAWMTEVMVECHRLLKPGGYAVVWSLPRTCHWTAWAMEDAGFIIRDQLAHVFASGFPKGKAQLKPAREDWWLARKPGPLRALNIERSRISVDGRYTSPTSPDGPESSDGDSTDRTGPWHVDAQTLRSLSTRLRAWSEQSPEAGNDLLASAIADVVEGRGSVGSLAGCLPCRHCGDALVRFAKAFAPTGALQLGDVPAPLDPLPTAQRIRECRCAAHPSTWDELARLAGEEGDGWGSFAIQYSDVQRGREGEPSANRRYDEEGGTNLAALPGPRGGDAAGRWPSNLLLSDPELFDVANPGVVGSGAVSESGGRTLDAGDQLSNQWFREMEGRGEPIVRATDYHRDGDSGGYSRFFIVPKSDRGDREPTIRESTEGLYCNCKTVKPDGWERPDLSQLAPMASTSRRRATSEARSEDDNGSSTTLFGSSISDPSHQGSRSTTSTATSRTIESPTSSPSILSPISGSTPGQSSSTASGGSDARSAPPTDRSPRNGGTSAGRAGRSTGAADPAISPASSEISVCGDCGKPRSTAATGGADGVTRAARRNSHPT